ncbi:MAG TPA: hypothetical protein VFI95_00500 [Terriglobales bacterium]|nr:hypothetical protein [Terriglobales bacterium]
MNWDSWLLWGFVATTALSVLLEGTQGMGLTRMNLPFMIGTMFTVDRDRAKAYGFIVHVLNGWVFSLGYVFIFESLHQGNWWLGAVIGLGHALFVLVVLMSLMPGLHPRIASEQYGPTASRMLEPPGFMALNYGIQTPISVVLAHVVFGVILGSFYHLT